ncbi:hypothetical protein FRUB_01102 [Fimbriiglobus ruber]|uniref:Uncharacterized protein n=1 Tax=Fimbriiglobus ruber TaxID=1908690 RepID=A0A225E2E1_9BACT|nr:hypothetical protein FRUB_01102 [Fimbriiglobus ruber]
MGGCHACVSSFLGARRGGSKRFPGPRESLQLGACQPDSANNRGVPTGPVRANACRRERDGRRIKNKRSRWFRVRSGGGQASRRRPEFTH